MAQIPVTYNLIANQELVINFDNIVSEVRIRNYNDDLFYMFDDECLGTPDCNIIKEQGSRRLIVSDATSLHLFSNVDAMVEITILSENEIQQSLSLNDNEEGYLDVSQTVKKCVLMNVSEDNCLVSFNKKVDGNSIILMGNTSMEVIGVTGRFYIKANDKPVNITMLAF